MPFTVRARRELFTGDLPYRGVPGALLGHHIIQDAKRPPWPPATPAAYRQLAERCWAANPADRPTFDEVLAEIVRIRDGVAGTTPPLTPVTPKPRVAKKPSPLLGKLPRRNGSGLGGSSGGSGVRSAPGSVLALMAGSGGDGGASGQSPGGDDGGAARAGGSGGGGVGFGSGGGGMGYGGRIISASVNSGMPGMFGGVPPSSCGGKRRSSRSRTAHAAANALSRHARPGVASLSISITQLQAAGLMLTRISENDTDDDNNEGGGGSGGNKPNGNNNKKAPDGGRAEVDAANANANGDDNGDGKSNGGNSHAPAPSPSAAGVDEEE